LKRQIFFALILILLILPVNFAVAQEGGKFQIGHIKIVPTVIGEAVYDNNIYKGNGKGYAAPDVTKQEAVVSDLIYHIKPSIMGSYDIPERGSISLGWQWDIARYNTETANNWSNNSGFLNVDYAAPEGILFGFKNAYAYSTDAYGNADQYSVGQTSQRWTDDLNTKLGYHFGSTIRSIFYYNYYIQQYEQSKDWAQNYNQNMFGIGFEARFLPKTWGFVRYLYTAKTYIDNDPQAQTTKSNSKANAGQIGFTWDPGAKLNGEVNFGYQWKSFDNQWVNLNNTGDQRQSSNSWSAATLVNFAALEQSIITLSISRVQRDSSSNTNEFFYDTGLGLSLSHKFFTKYTFKVGASVASNDYNRPPVSTTTGANPPANNRNDTNWMANVGLDYKIQDWLGAGVAYAFSSKNSNYEENNYSDNQFSFNIKLVY